MLVTGCTLTTSYMNFSGAKHRFINSQSETLEGKMYSFLPIWL